MITKWPIFVSTDTNKSDSSKDLNRIGQLLIVWKIWKGEGWEIVKTQKLNFNRGKLGEKLNYLYDLWKLINCAKSLVKNS